MGRVRSKDTDRVASQPTHGRGTALAKYCDKPLPLGMGCVDSCKRVPRIRHHRLQLRDFRLPTQDFRFRYRDRGRSRPVDSGSECKIPVPERLRDCLRFIEVRLVYDKRARRYTWHIVVEDGLKPKPAPGTNVVSVDLGEIHPAVVGDKGRASVITCRERRSLGQGHAKRLAKIQRAIARKKRGSRRRQRLVRAKARMNAKHRQVMRDIEHKVSRAVVEFAAERQAGTIVIGDIRDIADRVDCGKEHNGRMSRLDHGKIRTYVAYKAAAEGIKVELADEHHTTKTCPHCGNRHKPRGRTYRCPSCRFQAHRDVVGQINILSRFLEGDVGRIPAPADVKYRIPHNLRVMRRCRDTGQGRNPVARERSREAAGL